MLTVRDRSQPYLLLHGLYFFAFIVVFLTWSLIHYAAEIGDGYGAVHTSARQHAGTPAR